MSGGFPIAKKEVVECFFKCPVCGWDIIEIPFMEKHTSLYGDDTDYVEFRLVCDNPSCEARDESGGAMLKVYPDGHGYVEWF